MSNKQEVLNGCRKLNMVESKICNFYQIFLQRFHLGELVYERYKKLVQNI